MKLIGWNTMRLWKGGLAGGLGIGGREAGGHEAGGHEVSGQELDFPIRPDQSFSSIMPLYMLKEVIISWVRFSGS